MDKQKLNRIINSLKDGELTSEDFLASPVYTEEERKYVGERYIAHLEGDGDPIDTQGTIRTWGTDEADHKFSPIEDDYFAIIAAKGGVGKTAFGYFLANENAKSGTGKTLFISLEMSTAAIAIRFAREYAGITKWQWRDKSKIGKQQKIIYKKKKRELEDNWSLDMVGFENKPTLDELFDRILDFGAFEPKIVFIDNLDLISTEDIHEKDEQKVICERIKNFCKKNKIPIILIHHIRKGSGAKDRIVSGDDMRGSGKIRDNIDALMMCKRVELYDGRTKEEAATFMMMEDKDRSFGDGGFHTYYFNKGSFEDKFQPNF